MSGIYIPDMELPNSCMNCALYNWHGCKATNTIFSNWVNIAKRQNNCPLIAAPSYGRLVNELNPKPKTMADWIRSMPDRELAQYLYSIGDESWYENSREYTDEELRHWLEFLHEEYKGEKLPEL